jgi:hypothetical protein
MHERGSKSIAAIRAEQFDEYAGLVIRDWRCNGSAKRFDLGELGNFRFILGWQGAKLFKLGDLSSYARIGHLIRRLVRVKRRQVWFRTNCFCRTRPIKRA